MHSAAHGAWWFSSCDHPARAEPQIGRFDLPTPFGTCYLGAYLAGSASESLREADVDAAAAQLAANARHLSQMPLDRWYGKPIADFTSREAERHGAPADIAALPRSEARPWARAACAVGFAGVLYRLREDPARRFGLALFGDAGEHPPPGTVAAVPLPVGLRHELEDLFEGEYRGDPLPR